MNPLPPIDESDEENGFDLLRERLKGVFFKRETEMLMTYLEEHDTDIHRRAQRVDKQCNKRRDLDMRRRFRKIMGERHWRRYVRYYRREMNSKQRYTYKELTAAQEGPDRCSVLPPFPTLSHALNADVTKVIFGFLDEKSIYEATKVSRSFRDAFIPRQRNVTMAGFPSVEAFRRMNFQGAVFFSGAKSDIVTPGALNAIVMDHDAYPNLASFDLRGCKNINAGDAHQFRTVMGPRLETFKSDLHDVFEL